MRPHLFLLPETEKGKNMRKQIRWIKFPSSHFITVFEILKQEVSVNLHIKAVGIKSFFLFTYLDKHKAWREAACSAVPLSDSTEPSIWAGETLQQSHIRSHSTEAKNEITGAFSARSTGRQRSPRLKFSPPFPALTAAVAAVSSPWPHNTEYPQRYIVKGGESCGGALSERERKKRNRNECSAGFGCAQPQSSRGRVTITEGVIPRVNTGTVSAQRRNLQLNLQWRAAQHVTALWCA